MLTNDIKFPFALQNATPVGVDYYWESIPAIQLTTKRNWWGNALQPNNIPIGSVYAETGPDGITIDREFLARKEALAVQACDVLVKMKIADSVSATCTNPQADRIECEVVPKLSGAAPLAVVVVGDLREYERAPAPRLVWQDTIDSATRLQDTIDSGNDYQDEA